MDFPRDSHRAGPSTAPFLVARFPPAEPGHLIHLGSSPDGFLRILANWRNMLSDKLSYEEQLQSYFALCLACHHATVGTFVPTDVDTKIRGILWANRATPMSCGPCCGWRWPRAPGRKTAFPCVPCAA